MDCRAAPGGTEAVPCAKRLRLLHRADQRRAHRLGQSIKDHHALATVAGSVQAASKKNMQQQFLFEADQQTQRVNEYALKRLVSWTRI